MVSRFDSVYRTYVLARRLPHLFDRVAFVPLRYDHHPVWDIHRRYLQYRSAPPLPGKVLHVINRMPTSQRYEQSDCIAEVEHIFSLLPREILRSRDYRDIESHLDRVLGSHQLKGVIIQSPGALAINQRWLDQFKFDRSRLITIAPNALETRPAPSFNQANEVRFLIFASKFYEKGLHILIPVAERLAKKYPHFRFTLVSARALPRPLPSNIQLQLLPNPDLETRRRLYFQHDYLLNLSLGDSLGVFLDALRFQLPVVGYLGQHGSVYCPENPRLIDRGPIFIYDQGFLTAYNMFEFEEYLQQLEEQGAFLDAQEKLYQTLIRLDQPDEYPGLIRDLSAHASQFSAQAWSGAMRDYYKEF